jgi:hypothetical protein
MLWAACGGGSGQAAPAIEAYLQARVASDATAMINLSCPAWEAQARIEAASFQSMQARLEGVACADGEQAGDSTLVNCTGKIVTTYNGETREWSVADHPFQAVRADGEWRMCGYN